VRASAVRKWPGYLGSLPAAFEELAARRVARRLERDFGVPAGELAVVSGGSIAHVYIGRAAEGATHDQIRARFPRLIPSLAASGGVGLLVVRRTDRGPLVMSGTHTAPLDDRDALARLAPFRAVGVELLQRLIRFVVQAPSAGDLVLYGAFAPAGSVAFDRERGSHGGVHPDELDLFALLPPDLSLEAAADGGFDPATLHDALRQRYASATSSAIVSRQ
jgi:hypothetical protein